MPQSNETTNNTYSTKDMIFNDGHRLSITVYSILFVISSIGNSTVLYLLIKRRLRGALNNINIMLMHLAIADLMVTFLLMPLEIAWAWTVQWRSTDFMCRLMSFFRVFGLYLSSFVMVCISLDRYYAILKPLKRSNNRGRIMLACAWLGSLICSIPQAILFHLEEHPNTKGYYQCVTFNSFLNELHDLLYQIGTMCAMYAFPLIVFIYCYGAIYLTIYRKSKRSQKDIVAERFRRSNDDVLGRAKKRTLKMTITIVIVFIICWTPYYTICMWYWFDLTTVDRINSLVRKALFVFASTNSCMNPLVYGLYNIRGRLNNNNNNVSMNNRHTSLSHRLDSSNQLIQQQQQQQQKATTNGNGNMPTKQPATSVIAAAAAATHVVRLALSNGTGVVANANETTAATVSTVTKLMLKEEPLVTSTPSSKQEFNSKPQKRATPLEKSPMICMNCGDSIELTNLDKI